MDGTISSATEQAWPAITAMVASAQARIEQARARGLIGGGESRTRRQAPRQIRQPRCAPAPAEPLPEHSLQEIAIQGVADAHPIPYLTDS